MEKSKELAQALLEVLEDNIKLRVKMDKAIEYIKENAFEVVNSEHKTLLNIEELLAILGDKE